MHPRESRESPLQCCEGFRKVFSNLEELKADSAVDIELQHDQMINKRASLEMSQGTEVLK